MAILTATLLVPYAIVVLRDPRNPGVEIPADLEQQTAKATNSCVAIATLADVDGEATIRFESPTIIAPLDAPHCVFEGAVQTPSGRLAVETCEGDSIIEMPVSSAICAVRVFVDDVKWPGVICI